jgi:hypothetical protein
MDAIRRQVLTYRATSRDGVIAMRITEDAPCPVWDDFEHALECADFELRSYYDTVTGEVCLTGPFEDDPGERERIDADPARYLEIRRVDGTTEHEWMSRFAAGVADLRLQGRLDWALGGPKPLRRFREALLGAPAERAAWFALRDRLLKEWIVEWFEERDLAVGAPPKWWAAKLTD